MKVGTPGAYPESLLVPVEATEDERALARLRSWGDDPLTEIAGWSPSANNARCAYLIRAVTHRPELKEASDEAVLFELDLHRIGAPKACALAGWRMTSVQVERLEHLRDRGEAYAAALIDTPQGLRARWSWVLQLGPQGRAEQGGRSATGPTFGLS